MKLYYQVNAAKKKAMIKMWRHGHRGWKIGVPVLVVSVILCIVIFIGVFAAITILLGEPKETDTYSIPFLAGMLAFLSALVPSVIVQALWIRLFRKTESPYIEYTHEYIRLGEAELVVAFHNKYNHNTSSMIEYRIPYDNIKEMQLNGYYGRLSICGNLERIDYEDYTAGVIHKQWDTDTTGNIGIMLYYEEEKTFLEELQKRTGINIRHYTDSKI